MLDIKQDQRQLEEYYGKRYTLQKALGRGTYGAVYSALNNEQGQHVAIKFIKKNPTQTRVCQQLDKEAKHLKQLSQCEGIVQFISMINDVTIIIVVMEKMQTDLYQVIKEEIKSNQKILTENICIIILRQLLRSLFTLRQRKILHRDIKPSNIGVNLSIQELKNSSQRIHLKCKLLDFGLSKNESVANSYDIGTQGYQAPELLQRTEYSHQADIYSLGITMVYLATGRSPSLQGYTEQVLSSIQDQQFRDILTRMIEQDPSKRLMLTDEIAQFYLVFPQGQASTEITNQQILLYDEQQQQKVEEIDEEPPIKHKNITNFILDKQRYTLMIQTAQQLLASKRDLQNSKFDYLCMNQQFTSHINYLMRNSRMLNRQLFEEVQQDDGREVLELRKQLIKDSEMLNQFKKIDVKPISYLQRIKQLVLSQEIPCFHISQSHFRLNFYQNNQDIYSIIQGIIKKIEKDKMILQKSIDTQANSIHELRYKDLVQNLTKNLIYLAFCKGSLENMFEVHGLEQQLDNYPNPSVTLTSILYELKLTYN